MGDFMTGFTRTKRRRPAPRPKPADVIRDDEITYNCHLKRWNGEPCDRVIGPYFNRTLYRDAVAVHLAAQHVNDLAPMNGEDKSDMRMYRADTDGKGYERPTW